MNIYYNPEKFGLEIFDESNIGGSYEFDMLVVWKNKSGELFWATDKGCSCPIPFENVGLNSLLPIRRGRTAFWEDAKEHPDVARKVREYLATIPDGEPPNEQ